MSMTNTDRQPTSPFVSLPPLMQQVLDHEENIDVNMAVENDNGLSRQQGDAMMGVIRKIILKIIAPAALVETIKRDVGLADERAKKLALDLLGRRFLAMQWYIGNVEGLIEQLGGRVEPYLTEAKRRYPEVFAPSEKTLAAAEPAAEPSTPDDGLLRDFDRRITTAGGRAEILFRLTALGARLDALMADGALSQSDGESLMKQLDAVSYAVNTQDLNPFEVQSIKRRLTRLMRQIHALGR